MYYRLGRLELDNGTQIGQIDTHVPNNCYVNITSSNLPYPTVNWPLHSVSANTVNSLYSCSFNEDSFLGTKTTLLKTLALLAIFLDLGGGQGCAHESMCFAFVS